MVYKSPMNILTAVTTAAAAPAGGAATQDIVLATGGALVLTTLVVVLGVLYRSGQIRWLHNVAGFAERQWGLPARVTLWGPTHLMLFGGAAMRLVGRAALLVEGERAARRESGTPRASGAAGRHLMNFQKAGLIGGLLIGMSTFQGEFDFGVPQFQMVFQPMLIAFAGGIALVTARVWGGRGAALIAVGFFVVIRGLVAVFVHPVMGEITPHFPLYIVEGV